MRRRDYLLTRFFTILGGLPLGRIGRGVGMGCFGAITAPRWM
jgi:hypothetical protein